jgi:hypothetical protein
MSCEDTMGDEQQAKWSQWPAPGDWWWFASACSAILHDRDVHDEVLRSAWHTVAVTDGYRWERTDSTPAGSLTITGRDGKTTIFASAPTLEDMEYWRELGELLQHMATQARDLQRAAEPTADQVIQRYYRIKAQGSKITLRQLAEETGFNHSYLRDVKSAYDKAGKWGSKKKKPDTPDK